MSKTPSLIKTSASHQFNFKIWGIRCSSCSLSIQNSISQFKDVTNIFIDVATGNATITATGDTTEAQILEAIDDAGFTAERRVLNNTTSESNEFSEPSTPLPAYRTFGLYNLALIILLVSINYFALMPSLLTWAGTMAGLSIAGLTFASMATTGRDFYTNAFKAFKERRATMDTLIALATGVAWISSVAGLLFPALGIVGSHFLAIPMILGITSTGLYFREKEKAAANEKITSLSALYKKLQPQKARVVSPLLKNTILENPEGEQSLALEELPLSNVFVGDLVLVRKHETLPMDGIIVSTGETKIEQAFLTGESIPANKGVGEQVYAGTVNLGEPLLIKTTSEGKNTHIYQIFKNVEEARANQGTLTRSIDRYATWVIPVIFAIASLSFVTWAFIAGINVALYHAIAVLLCACPCSLLLASPITEHLSVRTLFDEGILIHKASALESLAQVDTIVFDKTGTLTVPQLQKIISLDDAWTPEMLLLYAASLEVTCTHPIADALKAANNEPLLNCLDKEIDNQGVSGTIDGHRVIVGSQSYLTDKGIVLNDKEHNTTATYMAINGILVGQINLRHKIRPEAKEAIEALHTLQFKTIMLTGDHIDTANTIAEQLGITEVHANQSGENKGDFINQLKEKGNIVAVVGDGLNDYHALGSSHVSLAVESWTQAASTANISLRGNLHDVGKSILAAKKTMGNIRQNLLWSLAYNAFTLAAASGALMFLGISISPIVASGLMALSSLIVVLNATRVRNQIIDAFKQYHHFVLPTEPYVPTLPSDTVEKPRGICGDVDFQRELIASKQFSATAAEDNNNNMKNQAKPVRCSY